MRRVTWFCCFVLLWAGLSPAQSTEKDTKSAERWNHTLSKPLPSDKMGPFIRLSNRDILTVHDTEVFVSPDEGKTWTSRPLFKGGQNFKVSKERALLRTSKGTLVLVFLNLAELKWGWDSEKNQPIEGIQVDVWVARSFDEGKTWPELKMAQKGYCGAVRDLIQTREGNLVFVAQDMLPKLARHITQTYVSKDDGATWQASNILDLGGRGHHDGATEGTVEELKDGRLWLLVRTNLDRFWEALSEDGGLTWRVFRPSQIGASSAPGMLKRLKSGRLVLIWNQLYPEGQTSYERRGGVWSNPPGSWHREELSIAFSEDEGHSWSKPVVLAKEPRKWLSYAYLFEASPGNLWVTTMQGEVRLQLREADFLAK